MDLRLESEVGGMHEDFNMQDFLLSSDEDQLKFLSLLNPCHAYKTAFGKRLWADQLLRFLKAVASASITAALVTLECRIPDIDGELEENPEDNDEEKDGEKGVNSTEEEQEEVETTEGENMSLEEIDVTALQSLCRLLDEWQDAKLKHYLKKRNICSNNITEAEEAGQEKRLPTVGRQDPGKPSRFLDDVKKSEKKPHEEKIPAFMYSGIDSKPAKPPTENTKPVPNPNLGCLYSTIFWNDPKPYSKPLVLGINSTSKPSPSSNSYSQNSVSGKYNKSIFPPSPPISPQSSVSVSPPVRSAYPSSNYIRTGYGSALPPSPPVCSTPSKASSKAPVITPPPPATDQRYTWIPEHQRKGHYVNSYCRKDGTLVKGHYRGSSTVAGHLRKIN